MDNIWNNNVPKKITIARHCCCYTWIKELWRRQMRRPHRSGSGRMAPCSQVAARAQASHIAPMIAKTPKRRKAGASNPLASALARWESEGGAPGPASEEPSRHRPIPLSAGEERILQCLGAAVLLQWNDLPTWGGPYASPRVPGRPIAGPTRAARHTGALICEGAPRQASVTTRSPGGTNLVRARSAEARTAAARTGAPGRCSD